jgi:hypothetical protein
MSENTTPPQGGWNDLDSLRMKPRVTEEQRSFSPGWAVGLVVAAALLAVAWVGANALYGVAGTSEVAAAAWRPLVIWAIALGVGWGVWKATSANTTAGRAAFAVVALALGGLQATNALHNAAQYRLERDVQKAMDATLAAFQRYENDPLQETAEVDSAVAFILRDFDALRARADVQDSRFGPELEAMRPLAVARFERELGFMAVAQKPGTAMAGGIEGIVAPGKIESLRAQLQAMKASALEYGEFEKQWPAKVTAGLQDVAMSDVRRKSLVRWLGAEQPSQAIAEAVAAIADFVDKTDVFLGYLDAQRAHWEPQYGDLMFDSEPVLARHRENAAAMGASIAALQRTIAKVEAENKRRLQEAASAPR